VRHIKSIHQNKSHFSTRKSKYRSSLVETTDQISRFDEACSLKPNEDDHLSSFEELPSAHENKSNDDVEDFTQMKVILVDFLLLENNVHLFIFMFFFKSDEEHILQQLEEEESRRDKNLEDDVNLTVKETAEEEQKSVNSAEKFAQNSTFDVIGIMNLSSMNLTDRDVPMIIQRAFGEKKKKCFGLILRENALTSEGIKMLVDSLLKVRTNLKYLSFADNTDIGDEGIEHLTRLLQKNRSMNFLAVPNTGITDRGVRILANTLCRVGTDSPCAPLEKLYLSFNKLITDESMPAILQIIEKNRTLKLLSLRNCNLSDKARRGLRQLNAKLKKRKLSIAE
jgi:hypothetical protein